MMSAIIIGIFNFAIAAAVQQKKSSFLDFVTAMVQFRLALRSAMKSEKNENLTHFEQYKMLREEIMQHMREVNRTEYWGATGAAAVYAWLIVQKNALPTIAWYISPFLIIFCALRVISIVHRMRSIAGYLRLIEKNAFKEKSELLGWERYLDEKVGHLRLFSPATIGYIFWTLLVAASFGASWLLSHWPKPAN